MVYVGVSLLFLTVSEVGSQTVQCGTRHFLRAHPLTVYQLLGQEVLVQPYEAQNGIALEWYVRPRPGTIKKELLKYLSVTNLSLNVLNMTEYCERASYHYKWYSDGTKSVTVFESARVVLMVGVEPRILPVNLVGTSFDVMEGSTLRICFDVEGSPDPVVSLRRINLNRHVAISRDRYRFSSDCLRFLQLRMDDTGLYLLEGRNCFGTSRHLFNISVYPQPTTAAPTVRPTTMLNPTTEQPSSAPAEVLVAPVVTLKFDEMSGHHSVDFKQRRIRAIIGTDLLLPYIIGGSPLPTVSWYKNGYKLKSDSIVEFSDKLIAMRRVIVDDTGFYQVIVRNSAGEYQSDFQLRVLVGNEAISSSMFDSTATTRVETEKMGKVKATERHDGSLNRDSFITDGKEDGKDSEELTWWIVLLIGIGCVSLTIALVLWIMCCSIGQSTALCNCSSSHIHHHHNMSTSQKQKWLSPKGDIPSPKAVNNLLAVAQVDHSRDPPRSPPPPSEQPPIQYEIPLPLTKQEEQRVAELLAASPTKRVRFASELELKPIKITKEHECDRVRDQHTASRMKTLTWPPRGSSDNDGYLNLPPSSQAPPRPPKV